MIFHVVEQYHTWASGETGVTIVPAQIVERLVVGPDDKKIWVRESEINPSIHTLYDPPKPVHDPAPVKLGPSSTFKPKGNRVLTEIQTSRLVQAQVRPGETRTMTLLPSPTLEPDAKPLTIPYDEALLAWRHHQWPDCKMTDGPPAPEAPPYIDLSERPPEEESPIPSPAVVALDAMEALKARMDAGRKMIPDEIGELMEAGETIAEARDRLTPKLNSELSKLKNLRGFAGQDLAREAEIETLLGMLSRLGEG